MCIRDSHQPKAVIADTNTLETLPDRELSSGLAEVIKYGLINDADFFNWLEKHMSALIQRDKNILAYAIQRSCTNKAIIVAADEKETGQRALLNLGHTFGHAIETGIGYGKWLHGEAVATGIAMAANMSNQLGWLSSDDQQRIIQLLNDASLPNQPPHSLNCDDFLRLMTIDKKVLDGKLRLILMQGIGKSIISQDFSFEVLRKTLTSYA